jgi:tripartite-type tricarboxylate transporter receptor subunit TctC
MPIVEQIAEATRKVMADADFQKMLITSGFEPILDSGPEPTRQFIADETARWVPIMKRANFKME